MKILPTPLLDLFEIEPRVFGDDRGYFFESYSAELFKAAGIQADFVQDNESYSNAGVVRGLHFQVPTKAQGKRQSTTRKSSGCRCGHKKGISNLWTAPCRGTQR